jgi:hypothetical protein
MLSFIWKQAIIMIIPNTDAKTDAPRTDVFVRFFVSLFGDPINV